MGYENEIFESSVPFGSHLVSLCDNASQHCRLERNEGHHHRRHTKRHMWPWCDPEACTIQHHTLLCWLWHTCVEWCSLSNQQGLTQQQETVRITKSKLMFVLALCHELLVHIWIQLHRYNMAIPLFSTTTNYPLILQLLFYVSNMLSFNKVPKMRLYKSYRRRFR